MGIDAWCEANPWTTVFIIWCALVFLSSCTSCRCTCDCKDKKEE